MSVPPGYAAPGAASSAARPDPARPLLWFWALLTAALAALGWELGVRQPAAHLAGDEDARAASLGALVLGAAAGLIAARRRIPASALGSLLLAASLLASASGALWHLAQTRAELARVLPVLLPVAAGSLALGIATLALRMLGRPAALAGVAERALDPFRLATFGVALGLGATASAYVGLARAAAATGMALGIAAAWLPLLAAWLEARPQPRAARFAGLAAVAFGALAITCAELLVPLDIVGSYPSEVVYAAESPRGHRLVVVSAHGTHDLYVDDELRVSTLDAHRYFEALCDPPLAEPRRRVALVGWGEGLAEREILHDPRVESVTLVVPDRAITETARRLAWLAERSKGANAPGRVRMLEREPMRWLAESSERFDAMILDLPDPTTYAAGKRFSRRFFALLRERLADDGVASIAAGSSHAAPETFAGVIETARAAGLAALGYRAAVATAGEAGFVLAARRALVPPARFADLFLLPRDVVARGEPSLLHDQRIVASFDRERRRARRIR
jgi:spermidine synthase